MKSTFLALSLISLISSIFGQTQITKNKVGVNVLQTKHFPEVFYSSNTLPYSFYTFAGMYYQRNFKYIDGRLSYNRYNVTQVFSETNCNDCFYGTGYINGNEIRFGFLKTLFVKKISLHIGVEYFFSKTVFSPNYEGGFSGGEYHIHSIKMRSGLSPFVALCYRPSDVLSFTYEFGGDYDLTNLASEQSGLTRWRLAPIKMLSIDFNF